MAAASESVRRGLFPARVLDNRSICPDHYRLTLSLASLPPSRPGQFINIRCDEAPTAGPPRPVDWPEGRIPRLSQPELLGRKPLLRRPFSLAGRRDAPDGSVQVDIIHHVVGVGTTYLAQLRPGREVSVLGPLGNGFTIAASRPLAAVLGGGAGIPPLVYLAEALTAAGKEVVAFAGARTAEALPLSANDSEPPSRAGQPSLCTAEFAAWAVPTVVTTDDGSLGLGGLVHEGFLRWLDERQPAAADLAVYACGPEPMMQAVAEICLRRGIDCQVAMERYMACGLGTCQSCVCKVRSDAPPGWAFKLVCRDGPVFRAEELIWQ